MLISRPLLSLALAFLLATAAGCAASPATTRQPAACAQCLVCKHNADLACIDVEVDAKTPRLVYEGKTYYFCSDECQREFEKHPEKYAPVTSK